MVWDSNKFNMDDSLNVNEREQTIGFCTNITTMLNTSKGACRQILRQIMDMNCMTWIFNLTLAKQTHLAHSFPHTHLPHTCVAPHFKCPWWCKGGNLWQHKVYIFSICGMRYTKRDLWVWGKKLMIWGLKDYYTSQYSTQQPQAAISFLGNGVTPSPQPKVLLTITHGNQILV